MINDKILRQALKKRLSKGNEHKLVCKSNTNIKHEDTSIQAGLFHRKNI